MSASRGSSSSMSRDSSFTHVHLHAAHHADMLEDFTRIKLPAEDINVPPHHQPQNPDDDDDVVPDQQAAFGIQRAQNKGREPSWKDLGLDTLLNEGPPKKATDGSASNQAVGGATTLSGSRGTTTLR